MARKLKLSDNLNNTLFLNAVNTKTQKEVEDDLSGDVKLLKAGLFTFLNNLLSAFSPVWVNFSSRHLNSHRGCASQHLVYPSKIKKIYIIMMLVREQPLLVLPLDASSTFQFHTFNS